MSEEVDLVWPTEDDYPLIHSVARSVRRQFPEIDHADLVQELSIWWAHKPVWIQRQVDGGQAGTRRLVRAMTNYARGKALDEKLQRMGASRDDLYFYSLAQLRDLLPSVFDRMAWVDRPDPRQTEGMSKRATRSLAEGSERLATLSDVSSGLDKLSDEDLTILYWAYGVGLSDREIGAECEVSPEAAQMRVKRALERLQRALGGERPDWPQGPGTRHVMSNATARAITSKVWEDE